MFPKPQPALSPNTYAYESAPLVKPTGFREYDARWLLEKEINLTGVQALGGFEVGTAKGLQLFGGQDVLDGDCVVCSQVGVLV